MQILNDILILFGIGIAVIFSCYLLRIPSIVGLLLTGVLVGPHGLGLINAVREVELLAEIGVVALLFTIGMGLSFEAVLQMKRTALLGGSIQILLTSLIGFLAAKFGGIPTGQAIFIGFLLSHSSTTIMLRAFQERAEVDSPQARIGLGISIFQDIMSVPMLLLIPVLAGTSNHIGEESPIFLVVKGIAIVIIAIFVGKWIVPRLLFQVVRTRNRELFLMSIIVIGLGVAGLTYAAGLSLALGAFLAGLIISESEYVHQALGDMAPFRDVFTSFFFISVGMLLNVSYFFHHPILILSITIGALLVKFIVASFAAYFLQFPLRTVLLAGMALSSIGEFSFVLAQAGVKGNVFNDTLYQPFLAVTILTMSAIPFAIRFGPVLAEKIMSLGLIEPPTVKQAPEQLPLSDHLVIIGFGVNGRYLARAAKAAGIEYVILEANPETVRIEKKKGQPIFFGDASQKIILERTGVPQARVVVIAISDPVATRSITKIIRNLSPEPYILTRTRFLKEVKPLYKLGANEVVPEEFETSVEIFTRVLRKYLVPFDAIERFIAEVRSDNYEMLRSLSPTSASLSDLKLHLSNVEINTFRIQPNAPAVDKTLAEIGLRKKYGITLLVIQRGTKTVTNPTGDTRLLADDVVILLATPENLPQAIPLFSPSS